MGLASQTHQEFRSCCNDIVHIFQWLESGVRENHILVDDSINYPRSLINFTTPIKHVDYRDMHSNRYHDPLGYIWYSPHMHTKRHSGIRTTQVVNVRWSKCCSIAQRQTFAHHILKSVADSVDHTGTSLQSFVQPSYLNSLRHISSYSVCTSFQAFSTQVACLLACYDTIPPIAGSPRNTTP